jgi:hypothetical protein
MLDLETSLRNYDWPEVAPQEFIQNTSEVREQEMTTPERIELVLYADRTLAPESVDALMAQVKVTYNKHSRSADAGSQVPAPEPTKKSPAPLYHNSFHVNQSD